MLDKHAKYSVTTNVLFESGGARRVPYNRHIKLPFGWGAVAFAVVILIVFVLYIYLNSTTGIPNAF